MAPLLLSGSAIGAPLSVNDAIRAAWEKNPAIVSSREMVAAARADAESARDRRVPTVRVEAKALGTTEPVGAFGLRLDQQRVAAADFDPARLNRPDLVGGIGLGATIVQPLYLGGRLTAGLRAADEQAQAEDWMHERRLQELSFSVVQAYFGAEVAEKALRFADDVLEHARETERLARSRNQQGIALTADLSRATAFRAQAESDRSVAAERVSSARAALVLLVGSQAEGAELASALTSGLVPVTEPGPHASYRPDLRAARLRSQAADAMVDVARGVLLPEVMAQASVETMRSGLSEGGTWYGLGLVARWNLSLAEVRATEAARRRAAAARSAEAWQERQAQHEVAEARRNLMASHTRIASATEAVAAAESARALRSERHQQGLLPLTEVLDAEAALAGARAMLLRSQYEARVAAAHLQLALGEPIEGVSP